MLLVSRKSTRIVIIFTRVYRVRWGGGVKMLIMMHCIFIRGRSKPTLSKYSFGRAPVDMTCTNCLWENESQLFVTFMSHSLHDTTCTWRHRDTPDTQCHRHTTDLPAVGVHQLAGRHLGGSAIPEVPAILDVAALEEVRLKQYLVPHHCLTLEVDLYHWEGVYRLNLEGLRLDGAVVVDGRHSHGVSKTGTEMCHLYHLCRFTPVVILLGYTRSVPDKKLW